MKSGLAVTRGRRRWGAALGVFLWLAACEAPGPPPAAPVVLLRVGQQTVTLADFEAALAIGELAYGYSDLQRPAVRREARQRLLNQLLVETLVCEQARVAGILVTDAELDAAEKRIRADYPEGAFEEALLENAVSLDAWRQRLRVRLLMEKTARETIGANISISAEEITRLITEGDALVPATGAADGAALVEGLRRRKIEAAYPEWVRGLRKTFTVEINHPQWERLLNRAPVRPPA